MTRYINKNVNQGIQYVTITFKVQPVTVRSHIIARAYRFNPCYDSFFQLLAVHTAQP